jgi:hypothetical protein
MKFFSKTLGLLLASLSLASCGGGGGNGGAYSPPQSGSITMQATTTTLPLNPGASPWFPSSPYSTEVDVVWRNADGTPVSGHDLTCSISPVEVASIHIPDDPTTTNIDESAINWTNVQVHSDTGHAICWVFSSGRAGTVVLTAAGVDPTTTRTVSNSITITVTSGVGTMPASVALVPTPAGVYLPSSGGQNTSAILATVLDGGNQNVPDPVSGNSGVDNIQFEIVGNAGDARLSTNSVSGPSSGTTVKSHTVHGQATVSFQAGATTPQGPVQVRATVDRADNNITNGIQDPVSATTSVIVSDGKLYSLQITSPDTDAILINGVSTSATGVTTGSPDGTYSLTVSALGLDRQQNPVLPGTPIRFGAIDEPVGTFNSGATANRFLIAGGDGDPKEGDTLFTAPAGQFQTAGGGAGPGDAVVVFGKTQHGAPAGNEDLESALTVQHVNSQTSLNTSSPFNRNDTTGTSVDNHAVLPYIVGRGQHGNITASALTNTIGVARASLNYTVSTLGHIVAMWAQGDGIDNVTSGSRRVTDATELVYPGVAPATLTAFPTPIPGNKTTTVTVCIADAQRSPIQGVSISFQLQLSGGTGSVDGNGAAGHLDNLTGPDGCVDASVTTSGVPASTAADGVAGKVLFAAGDATAHVDIVVQLAFLSAAPTQVCAPATGAGASISVTAYSTSGDPVAGVVIGATCSPATIVATPSSATTGSNGSAVFHVVAPATVSGTCTFATTGTAARTVSVLVGGASSSGFSPPCGP